MLLDDKDIEDAILDQMDFSRIQRVMECLEWGWVGIGIPTLYEVKHRARKLLREFLSSDDAGMCTCGFEMRREGDFITMSFRIEEGMYDGSSAD